MCVGRGVYVGTVVGDGGMTVGSDVSPHPITNKTAIHTISVLTGALRRLDCLLSHRATRLERRRAQRQSSESNRRGIAGSDLCDGNDPSRPVESASRRGHAYTFFSDEAKRFSRQVWPYFSLCVSTVITPSNGGPSQRVRRC